MQYQTRKIAYILFLFLFLIVTPLIATYSSASTISLSHGESWWGGGFNGTITVSNTDNTPLEDWAIRVTSTFQIESLWNGQVTAATQNPDGTITYDIVPETWNGTIQANNSVNVGFTGKALNDDISIVKSELYNSNGIIATDDDTTTDESTTTPDDDTATPDDTTTTTDEDGSTQAGVVFTVVSDWGSGFTANITMTSDETITDWKLEFDAPFTISSIWDARIESHNGTHYVIIPPSGYNQTLTSGTALSLGFNGSGTAETPTSVTINGESTDSTTTGASGTTTSDDTTTTDDETTPADDTIPAADSDTVIMGYFTQWGIYGRDYQVTDIPASKLTHIAYAFLGIDPATLTITSVDEYADFQHTWPAKNGLPALTWSEAEKMQAGNLGRLRQLKATYPHLHTLLSIGGWTLSTFFSDAALTETSREQFAQSAVEFMQTYDFDGIDLDWEYPVEGGLPACANVPITQISFETEKTCQIYRPEDTENYTALVQLLRRKLDILEAQTGKHYTLSIAAPAASAKLAYIDIATMSASLDFINLMTYDFHGAWESQTGHQAPLYTNPADNLALSVNSSVIAYIQAGAPREKLVVGVPFYGRGWQNVPATQNGLYQDGGTAPSASGAGNWEAGVYDYWKVLDMIDAGEITPYTDTIAQSSYAYGSSAGLFMTYDDTATVRRKAEYVQSEGLAGVMFWELSGDVRDVTSDRSLLGTLADVLLTTE